MAAFKKSIRNSIRWIVPYGIVKKYQERTFMINESFIYQKNNEIRNYFLALNRNEQSPDMIEIIDYFKDNKPSMLPYEFTRKYLTKHTDIFYDNSCKMRFVFHNGKKLYFPKGWTIEAANMYYTELLMEQDEDSPHRYETKDFTVKAGDVIADIGTAEGIWALTYAEKASKIYLFECEKSWIKALQKTFEPWKEKVIIVNKYISNINIGKEVTIDEYFKNKEINFIKADIEGAEIKLLEGGKGILSKNNDVKLILCTYHNKDDDTKIKEILETNGFVTEFSKRYIISVFDNKLIKPYERRGVIRAKK